LLHPTPFYLQQSLFSSTLPKLKDWRPFTYRIPSAWKWQSAILMGRRLANLQWLSRV
jgi:hypothetical protein